MGNHVSGCLLMDGSGSLKFKMARAVACRQIVVRYSRSTQPYTRRRAADSTSSTAKLALSKSLIWQQTISPVVGEPTLYKAVWDDYKIGSLKLVQYQQPMERRLADIVFTHKVRLNTTIWRRAVAAPSPLSGCLLMDSKGSLKISNTPFQAAFIFTTASPTARAAAKTPTTPA